MRFILFVINDTRDLATGDEMDAIDAFNERLRAHGHWVFAAGIGTPDTATVVDNRAGAGLVRAGSLFPDGEFYNGFWIIDAEDGEQAQALALEGSRACNRRVEVRPFL